jgi:hypothetical protein
MQEWGDYRNGFESFGHWRLNAKRSRPRRRPNFGAFFLPVTAPKGLEKILKPLDKRGRFY